MVACQNVRENALHLMVQNPFSLFVYWDITPEYLTLATASLPKVESGLQMRLMQETAGGVRTQQMFSVSANDLQGSAYFYGQQPYSIYYAEVGLNYQSGYFTLLRSRRTQTPPAGKATEQMRQDANLSKQSLDKANTSHAHQFLPFAYSPAESLDGRGD